MAPKASHHGAVSGVHFSTTPPTFQYFSICVSSHIWKLSWHLQIFTISWVGDNYHDREALYQGKLLTPPQGFCFFSSVDVIVAECYLRSWLGFSATSSSVTETLVERYICTSHAAHKSLTEHVIAAPTVGDDEVSGEWWQLVLNM